MNIQSQASQSLRKLVVQLIDQNLDTPSFCASFERVYNFDTDKSELTMNERQVFEVLFSEVVYFSPFSEERATIPNYRGEDEIADAARAAHAKLT